MNLLHFFDSKLIFIIDIVDIVILHVNCTTRSRDRSIVARIINDATLSNRVRDQNDTQKRDRRILDALQITKKREHFRVESSIFFRTIRQREKTDIVLNFENFEISRQLRFSHENYRR